VLQMTDRKPMQLRLPPDIKAWLTAEAERNVSSQNSEVIRAIRAAMVRAVEQPTTTEPPGGGEHER
jgi:hypothetical protein